MKLSSISARPAAAGACAAALVLVAALIVAPRQPRAGR